MGKNNGHTRLGSFIVRLNSDRWIEGLICVGESGSYNSHEFEGQRVSLNGQPIGWLNFLIYFLAENLHSLMSNSIEVKNGKQAKVVLAAHSNGVKPFA